MQICFSASAQQHAKRHQKKLDDLKLTWVSLALLKKYKEFPHRHVHSRLDACHTHTDGHTHIWSKQGGKKGPSAVFHVSVMDISLLSPPHFLSQEMEREWASAAVSLWPWITATRCTWATLTLHAYCIKKPSNERGVGQVGMVPVFIPINKTKKNFFWQNCKFLCVTLFQILEMHFRDHDGSIILKRSILVS